MKRADSNIPVPLPDCEVIGPAVSPVEHLLRPSHGGDGLLFVVAHPDDEVIGAGAHLPLWRKGHFIHVSDGAPQNLIDAKENGFNSSASYARARRQELERALLLAHVEPAQIHGLGFADQEVSRYLLDVVKALANIIRDIRPTLVVTHPYEGGHPDHDATAFAVHSAIANLKVQDGTSPALVEMTSYLTGRE